MNIDISSCSYLFIIIVLLSNHIHGANILGIYPTPSISHQVVFRALTKDLLARGHNLTVITADPIESNNPNLTQIDIGFTYKIFQEALNFADFKHKKLDEIDLYSIFLNFVADCLPKQFEYPEVQKLIQSRNDHNFDAVIVEFLIYEPWFAFAPFFNAPLIGITSLDTYADVHGRLGNVFNPVIHPEMLHKFLSPQTFQQRFESLKFYLYAKFIGNPRHYKTSDNTIKKYLPGVSMSAEEIKDSVQLMMTNTHPVLGFVRPIVPTTVQLGFMHIEEPNPLPNDLQEFLDNSKNGVIYMSLGSNVRSSDLSKGILDAFKNVFKSLKYDVLWKFEIENLEDKPSNVKISKWFPQADLLAHPKIKLFITQGGQQSMEEAIDRGIPMIAIPFLADQDANAHKIVRKKIGAYIDLFSITEAKLKDTILEVLKPEYKKNIETLRDLVHDQPMTSREKAVWWVEYVIRHNGTKHLDYIGRHIPFYQKYFLDFIGISFLLSALIIYLAILIMRQIIALSRYQKKKSNIL